MTLEELTALFRKLGAPRPESWASSQHHEGIDQLSRFVFLREAWRCVVPPDDTRWIDAMRKRATRSPDAPCAGAGPALERMLAAGVDRKDINELARVMQYETLFALCALLDEGGPASSEPELADLGWQLKRVDENGDVVGPIAGIHESVLWLDPSGREMRPKKD